MTFTKMLDHEMNTKKTQREKKGLFLYITPVTGVYLGDAIKGEYRIDEVTLFSPKRFLRTRRFVFGYDKWRKEAAKYPALTSSSVIAAVSAGGDSDTARHYGHSLIKDELSILSSSRLGYHSRDRRGIVGIAGCLDSYDTEDLLLGQTVDLMQTSSRRHATDQLRITDEFLKMQDQFFPYRRLIQMIRDRHHVDDNWRHLLRNVAILAGRSQNAIETADAFLWNMIGLEQLLLGEEEHSGHQAKLMARCKALFGYCPLWERTGLDAAFKKIYNARCGLVHEGNRSSISLDHVIISDLILSNVIGNLVFNSSRIPNKSALIEHSEKAKARARLGMDARGKGWHWHFSHLHYSEDRLKKFWAL